VNGISGSRGRSKRDVISGRWRVFQIIVENRVHIIKNFKNFIEKEHSSSRREKGGVKNLPDICQINIFGWLNLYPEIILRALF